MQRALRVKEGEAFAKGKEEGRRQADAKGKAQRQFDVMRFQRAVGEKDREVRSGEKRTAQGAKRRSATNLAPSLIVAFTAPPPTRLTPCYFRRRSKGLGRN